MLCGTKEHYSVLAKDRLGSDSQIVWEERIKGWFFCAHSLVRQPAQAVDTRHEKEIQDTERKKFSERNTGAEVTVKGPSHPIKKEMIKKYSYRRRLLKAHRFTEKGTEKVLFCE